MVFAPAVVQVERIFDAAQNRHVLLEPETQTGFRPGFPERRRIAVGQADTAAREQVQLFVAEQRGVEVASRAEQDRPAVAGIVPKRLSQAAFHRKQEMPCPAKADVSAKE